MQLNLPIFEQLSECENVLIAGMGGGFDIFCGLPIYFELQRAGYNVHLASLTHASLKRLRGARRITPTLIGIMASTESHTPYFPERHLTQWFAQELQQEITIWCFEKTGVVPLLNDYQALVDYLNIDGIILIDGGVDSLIRGDETEIGSIPEDIGSIAVVNELSQIPVRITTCLGFGAELEISYAHIFENMAALTKAGGFLGVCSLTQKMEAYQRYQAALLYTQNQPRQDASVINSSVISAAQGEYGDYHLTEKTSGSELWISPLMPIYWFFDLPMVARQNLLLPHIHLTETFEELNQAIIEARANISKRPTTGIPLK
jgi:hypothetical protein